jgi:uncharacterized membrane protein
VKRIRNWFVTGVLVLVPVMVTINIIIWFINTIDATVRQFFPKTLLPEIPGLGLLMALAAILIIGLLTHNYVGNWFVNLFDAGIRRLSIVGGIYGGIKKFLETILNPSSDKFKGVVLVEFPRLGMYSIGFRTGQPAAKIPNRESKHLVNVFVPCTPNPTSGFYLLVPEESLIPLDMSVQEAFRNVISMGIVGGETEHHHK